MESSKCTLHLPALLLEVKSCYSFDAVKGEAARERFPISAVASDIRKSFEYAYPRTAVLALPIVVHPREPVSKALFEVIKEVDREKHPDQVTIR